ncbi:MAG TPA: T9SS type A sorting domain-containing protein [Puia sp.]|nr:T9SS type A sorting domain-containing protein [Puia sp.]
MNKTFTSSARNEEGYLSIVKRISLLTMPACTPMLLLLIWATASQAQTGYLYIHTKALSQDLNQPFTFSVSGGSTSVPNFSLEDQALNIEPTDIGAGNQTGNGELWVVAGATQGANGAIYHRAPKGTKWNLITGQTGSAIDGADLGHFVMVNTAGDAYAYDGIDFIQIFNHLKYGTKAVDIANNGSINSCAGFTAIVDANGHVWKYTGDYAKIFSWKDITPNDNSKVTFKRLDINPSNNDIVLNDAGGNVTKINSSGSGSIYYGRTGAAPSQSGDVTVDGNGTMYSVQKDAQGMDASYRYNGTTWVEEPQTGLHYFLTSSDAAQIWTIRGYTAAQSASFANPSTIYTRMGNGTGTWFDDERVQIIQNDNAIMIPVTAGIYNISESQVANWNLQDIRVYDSASGSTTNVAGNSASVVVNAGQVVHVVFINGLVAPFPMPEGCGTTSIIQNFGSGATNTKGGPLTGLTNYHYYSNTSLNTTPEGYYSLTQNSKQWSNNTLRDHSGLNGGYFLIVNTSYAADQFYRQRITGLIPGGNYVLTFWAANLSTNLSLMPNILAKMTNISSGAELGSMATGALPSDNGWHQYSLSFTATVSITDLLLQNNAPGGFGNGFAIDDIGISQSCPVLPETLIDFKAEKQVNNSVLSWATTSNLNFDHFEIQRSTDGIAWPTIAKINADDKGNIQNKYEFSDNLPLGGINYYRVKAVSSNGIWLFSDIKELQYSNVTQWAISMYPNPVISGGTINIQSNEPLQMIRVFDINGRLAFVKNISSSNGQGDTGYVLDTGSLPAGICFVQIANSNGAINSLKLVKRN